MTEGIPERSRLGRGQALHRHAKRGEIIVAARGALRIRCAPQWLGERMLTQDVALREGEAHVVRESGWIAVCAQEDAEVVCMAAPGILQTWLNRLRRRLAGRPRGAARSVCAPDGKGL